MRQTPTSLFAAAALALAAALCGCRAPAAAEPAPSAPEVVQTADGRSQLRFKPEDFAGLSLAAVSEAALPGVLETTGQITFDDRLVKTITSRVQGRIEDVKVSVWDTVEKGQPILQLYSPDFMTAEEEYLQAQSASGLRASRDFSDMTEWLAASAKRKLELLGMEDADILAISSPTTAVWMRSPISGTVLQNQSMVGQAVNLGDVLYQVGTLDKVWITADIYEVDLAQVRVGQELEAVTTAYPDDTFHGRISRISPALDPNAHTAEIKCEVDNPGLKLKPQMLARVRILTRPGRALVVPQRALVFDGDGYYAFVQVAPDTLERRRVDISSWNVQDFARVRSGLKAGERVAAESLKLNALWHAARGESY